MVRVEFYGRLADAMGRSRDVDLVGEMNAGAFVARLAAEDEALREALRSVRIKIAVNDAIVPNDAEVADGDVVALLPPFSGG